MLKKPRNRKNKNTHGRIIRIFLAIALIGFVIYSFPIAFNLYNYHFKGGWMGGVSYAAKPTFMIIGAVEKTKDYLSNHKYYNFSKDVVIKSLRNQSDLVKKRVNGGPWNNDANLKYPFSNGNVSVWVNGIDVDNVSVDFNILYNSIQSKGTYISYITQYFLDQSYSVEKGNNSQYFKSGNIYCVIDDQKDITFGLSGGQLYTGTDASYYLITTSCGIIDDVAKLQNQLFKNLTAAELNACCSEWSKPPQKLNIEYIDGKYAYGETWREVDNGPGANLLWLAVKENGDWKLILSYSGDGVPDEEKCKNIKIKYTDIPSEVYKKACWEN